MDEKTAAALVRIGPALAELEQILRAAGVEKLEIDLGYGAWVTTDATIPGKEPRVLQGLARGVPDSVEACVRAVVARAPAPRQITMLDLDTPPAFDLGGEG